MKLRSFLPLPSLIPAAVAYAATAPPPEVIEAHPLISGWIITVLVSALSLSAVIHGFFLHRIIKQNDKAHEDRQKEISKLFGLYSGLEHRQTVMETSVAGCCGLPVTPGGRRPYDPKFVMRDTPTEDV